MPLKPLLIYRLILCHCFFFPLKLIFEGLIEPSSVWQNPLPLKSGFCWVCPWFLLTCSSVVCFFCKLVARFRGVIRFWFDFGRRGGWGGEARWLHRKCCELPSRGTSCLVVSLFVILAAVDDHCLNPCWILLDLQNDAFQISQCLLCLFAEMHL